MIAAIQSKLNSDSILKSYHPKNNGIGLTIQDLLLDHGGP